jgi:predicted ATPase
LSKRAVSYWLQAGKRAATRSANVEAIAHLEHGLELVSRLSEEDERDRLELDLRFALAPCLIASDGPASTSAMATFTRAHQLCQRQSDAPEYLQVMFWLVTASVVRGELRQALDEIATLMQLAETRDDQAALLNAMRGRAMILLFMGRIIEAHEEIKPAINKFSESDESLRLRARAAGQDAGAAALALLSWTLWLLGEVDEARTQITAALTRANEVGHPHTLAYVSYYAAVLCAFCDEPTRACEHAARCLLLSEDHGFRQWRSLAHAVKGISRATLDPVADSFALHEVRGALNEYRHEGYALGITALDVLLCPALLRHNQVEAALEVIDQGLETANHNEERLFEAELYRLKAAALSVRNAAEADARALLERALRIAKEQRARSLEIRIVKDLTRLLQCRGEYSSADALIAPYAESEGWRMKTTDAN